MHSLISSDTVLVKLLQSPSSRVADLAPSLASAAIALLAGWLGYLLATRQAREERRHQHLRDRITLFYAPMVGTLRRIRALTCFRAVIDQAAANAWNTVAKSDDPERDASRLFEPFGKQIDYQNEQLRKRIFPLYEHMVAIFVEHFWLAEASTQAHFEALSNFVDLWERHLDGSLPKGVYEQLETHEATLAPLYSDLTTQLERLTKWVTRGRAA